ncbi:hypothetical protein BUALT_Bualt16G0081600 [Buddleja alternifolia]|uniref:Uncharacterized protein n=1 Tax=Buddleja alternifolia TaxID=168488 RepID=A0AAV6WJ78_9LAMI|nr:hypothetical protein BUALT_Bualt16G0081600 [Buddleja alternifolia]
MATGAAGDGFLRGIFEVCLSGGDTGVQRRPYHKNCGCELHKSRGHCSHQSRNNNVSYPIRRSWSEGGRRRNWCCAKKRMKKNKEGVSISPKV